MSKVIAGQKQLEWWPTSRPVPYARNARVIPDSAVGKVAASIKEFGFKSPIIVDGEGVIIAGHTRLLAAERLGLEAVPVIVADDLSPAQVKAYRLADNRTAQESSWDMELLGIELEDLAGLDIDLSLTGFDADELAFADEAGPVVEDEVPEPPAEPITQLGDLWLLGEHRVLCGDSTSAVDVARLMGGNKADMVFTDPPWNVDYQGGTKKQRALENDNLEVGWDAWLTEALTMLATAENAPAYVVFGMMRAGDTQRGIEAAGWRIVQTLIWVKQHAQFGNLRAHYKYQHEPIYYCSTGEKVPAWHGPNNEVSVWEHDRASVNEFHPTQKPVAVPAHGIGNSSRAGAVVADPFLGSGSTLIAAEQTGRICYGMEIDPAYCDVIVQRWQNLTGKQATRES